ncbi:hypothetical protein [Elizabethkingia meningoseptica]|uniref:hypothetical protein n=1 Tax=Elizabethkingia meningoseptica TaxID=238 RepID=UPI0023AEE766|nr:hypothetical protein [Elizabethkingia meningoseptica]MDE5492236.1 hypothetical protein [Elizabethkingia meningoseptica]
MNNSTKQIENNKDFDRELSFIERMNCLDKCSIKIVGNENLNAHLSKNKAKFNLSINADLIEEKDNTSLPFILDNETYEIKKVGNTYNGTSHKVGKSPEFTTRLEINSFETKDFNQKSIFKAFYIVDLDEIKTFHDKFETVTHQRNGINYFYDCLRIELNGSAYDVTQLKDEERGFYVFECLEEQTFEDFSEICFSIRQAIGFITRLMVGDEEYIFDNSGKLYYSNYIRPSIKGMYSPITTRPHSYLDIERKIADSFFGKLTRISPDNLSNLVNKIYTEPEFSVAILVILEATSLRSLLLIPSSFAVIIEQLSKHLSIEETGLEAPITNKELRDKILEELQDVIDNNSEHLGLETIQKLKLRIKEINRPVNKKHLTNNEKLTRPFKQLGINLTLHDISIIEHRNDLLHGNILLVTDENKDLKDTDLYMNYVSAKLFTLISKLILKSIGYNGYVYNQAKYLEKFLKIETSEEYFEMI